MTEYLGLIVLGVIAALIVIPLLVVGLRLAIDAARGDPDARHFMREGVGGTMSLVIVGAVFLVVLAGLWIAWSALGTG